MKFEFSQKTLSPIREREVKLVNLTPHDIVIIQGETKTTIACEGVVARCVEEIELIEYVNDIPVVRKSFGAVENLPEPQEGVMYIVSALVAQAAKRNDVLFPGEVVRDWKGSIIGCKSLSVVAEPVADLVIHEMSATYKGYRIECSQSLSEEETFVIIYNTKVRNIDGSSTKVAQFCAPMGNALAKARAIIEEEIKNDGSPALG